MFRRLALQSCLNNHASHCSTETKLKFKSWFTSMLDVLIISHQLDYQNIKVTAHKVCYKHISFFHLVMRFQKSSQLLSVYCRHHYFGIYTLANRWSIWKKKWYILQKIVDVQIWSNRWPHNSLLIVVTKSVKLIWMMTSLCNKRMVMWLSLTVAFSHGYFCESGQWCAIHLNVRHNWKIFVLKSFIRISLCLFAAYELYWHSE